MSALSLSRALFTRASLAGLVSAAGCMSLSGLDGSSKYGCKAPEGVRCDSVSGNYNNAIQHNLPSQRKQPAPALPAPSAAPNDPSSASNGLKPVLMTGQPPSAVSSAATYTATPLRSQARVLRLWYKPWEDADRDLYSEGYVYVQIDEGRWLIDHAPHPTREAYTLLRPPAPVASRTPGAQQKSPTPPAVSGANDGEEPSPVNRPAARSTDKPRWVPAAEDR